MRPRRLRERTVHPSGSGRQPESLAPAAHGHVDGGDADGDGAVDDREREECVGGRAVEESGGRTEGSGIRCM
ncbi:MAG: hypothetical protein Q9228_006798, partial [Teloschistes exilis]